MVECLVEFYHVLEHQKSARLQGRPRISRGHGGVAHRGGYDSDRGPAPEPEEDAENAACGSVCCRSAGVRRFASGPRCPHARTDHRIQRVGAAFLMVIDTSALNAILLAEPESPRMVTAIVREQS